MADREEEGRSAPPAMPAGIAADDPRASRPIEAPSAGAAPTARWLAISFPTTGDDLRLHLSEFARRLADAARRDIDEGLAFPLVAAVFALGIALYFVLPNEPWWPATCALALGSCAVTAWRRHRGHAARGWVVFSAVACGLCVGAVSTARVAAPRLDHERTVVVEGRVVDIDATARGGTRLGVAVNRMEGKGLTPDTTPTLIAATLTLHGGFMPVVGDGVRFKARLKPPEGPVIPGGYDFARRAWFDGRGASGYLLGRAEKIDLGPPDFASRLLAPIGVLRHIIAERVRATLPGATGTIGAALMVGEQRAIPESANEPLRASGLTHIVSISGLHLSLVAGGVITSMRLIFVLFPALALRWPVKKWAAGAAIVAATIYLLLSGNQVAALRSHLMLSIALIAVIVDRPAITMYTIAVSAVAILLMDPSNALEPSFLMSYLAVIALVASYDLWRLAQASRPPPKKEDGVLLHGIGAALRHVEGLAFSSLVAGLATAPVIAGIFYRGAPYSILANMIVLPVTGILIMPAAVLAALLMPFGLDALPLWAMGLGIDFMVAVGRWVAAFPGGAGYVGLPHPLMMPLGILAVLWLSLWRSRVRLLGFVPALAATILLFAGPRPDVFVGRHGSPVAVRDVDGRLHVLAGPQDRFDTAIWLAADADPRRPDPRALGKGWTCDTLGCAYRLPGLAPGTDEDLVVAVVRDARAFEEDCRRATLVISALEAPPGCAARATVVDRTTLAHTGATTLVFTGDIRPAPSPDRAGGGARSAHDLGRENRPEGNIVLGPAPAPPPRPEEVATSRRRAPIDTTDDGAPLVFDAKVSDAKVSDPDPASQTAQIPAEGSSVHSPPEFAPAPGDGSGSADTSTDAGIEEPAWPRQDLAITTSLPRGTRPWTPRDPLAERREAAALAIRSSPRRTTEEKNASDDVNSAGSARPDDPAP